MKQPFWAGESNSDGQKREEQEEEGDAVQGAGHGRGGASVKGTPNQSLVTGHFREEKHLRVASTVTWR